MGKLINIFNPNEIIVNSELIKGLRAHIPKSRPLKKEEIKVLEKNGNYSSDWKKVNVLEGFDPARIRNSIFDGEIIIGNLKGEVEFEGINFPFGIYESFISNCVILGPCLIYKVQFLKGYIIKSGVIIYNTGRVVFQPESSMGNGIELSLGIEIGGREVKAFADITLEIAEKIATLRSDKELLSEYEKFIQDYLSNIRVKNSVLSENCKIISTLEVKNVFMGQYSEIKNATRVENVTLLSNEEELTEIKDGSIVENSILQWGSKVESLSIVSDSVLTEHSHVERHGKVSKSLLGPNTGVAEGEVTASLVGPFVGFHHQALLIAAFWPEGKGNVGYGANVGSNHTSKAPDQEIWCGEGTFFGLGTNIKFPANFRKAPYSIIATGVTTLPCKIEFPFSLINSPAITLPGVSPAFNEIIPGWVLSNNLFTIKRNEGKYRKRNKARRSKFDFEVFRPDIIDLMITARDRLKNVSDIKEFYLEKDIPGLGKNYLLEENRKKAIEIYTFFIQYYALTGLKRKVMISSFTEDILEKTSDDYRWEHERKIIKQEFPNKNLKELLEILCEMQKKIAEMVEESKRKDDIRGRKIIDDYDQIHTLAEEDSFVKETWEETRKFEEEVKNLLKKL